jgi:hypothetical protein
MVCSLTEEHADFDTTCPDFEKDELAVVRIERMKQAQKEEDSLLPAALAIEGKPTSNKIIYGFLMIGGGLLWIIIGLFALERFFFYPVIMIIIGIGVIIKASVEKAQEIKNNLQKPDTSHVLDDSKDLDNL